EGSARYGDYPIRDGMCHLQLRIFRSGGYWYAQLKRQSRIDPADGERASASDQEHGDKYDGAGDEPSQRAPWLVPIRRSGRSPWKRYGPPRWNPVRDWRHSALNTPFHRLALRGRQNFLGAAARHSVLH